MDPIGLVNKVYEATAAIEAAEKPEYKISDDIFPHIGKYRIKGFPMDSYHIACNSHKTRLQNVLRSPGIDAIEKSLLKQRFINLSAGQGGYVEKQRKILNN